MWLCVMKVCVVSGVGVVEGKRERRGRGRSRVMVGDLENVI